MLSHYIRIIPGFIFSIVKTRFLLFLLLLSISQISYAQNITLNGTVINARNHQPVPFATLGIKGKSIGTVANESGAFHFSIDTSTVSLEEQLIVSSVGYLQTVVPISRFKQGSQVIELTPSSTALSSVTVKPHQFKAKIFGRTGSSTIMTANMFTERNLVNDNLGKEQATVMAIDKYCYIKSFNMLVAFNRFENVKFRLNFYSVKSGQPDQLIVNKDILFDVTQRNGWLKVDLTPYNIYLEGYKEIAVAIQWVKSVKTDTVLRPAFGVSVTPVPFHAMYFRNKSQAEWKKMSPAYVGFNLTADSFKSGKDDKGTAVEEEDIPLNDSLKVLLARAGLQQEQDASGYGNNVLASKYLKLPDAKIYYEVYGNGEPLLLLHGNSQSIASFYKQIPVLAKAYQVIAVDTRAQGRSTDETTSPLTYEKFAQDMKRLLDTLHIKQANIIGWSDGGNTGLIMAAQYPAYVNKLVTMGAVLSPVGVERSLLDTIQLRLNRYHGEVNNQTRLLTLLLKEPQITNSNLQQIKAPVLVIAGEKDVVKPEHTQSIVRGIQRSSLLIIKDATHYAPQEKPLAFNEAVLKFLKQ